MKKNLTRRPYVRPRRSDSQSGVMEAPVFQPLEPRKLLYTLVANPNFDAGETHLFMGWVAMPQWYIDQTLDADNTADRSVRVVITLLDSNPNSQASVTVLDLDGNSLFPWRGQPLPDGGFTEQVNFSIWPLETENPDVPERQVWGTSEDDQETLFGLDGGYMPGWRVARDSMGNPIPGVWLPDNVFRPVHQLEWDEDELQWWDPEAELPDEQDIVIPETGYWFPEFMQGERLPEFWGEGTDDRFYMTADDQWVRDWAENPWLPPDTASNEPHGVDRRLFTRNPELFGMIPTDRNPDNGLADFNNGIGRIILSGTTKTTRLMIYTVETFDPLEMPLVSVGLIDPALDPFGLGLVVPRAAEPFGQPPENVGVNLMADGEVYQPVGHGPIVIGNPTNFAWWQPSDGHPIVIPDRLILNTADRESEGIIFADPSLNESMGRIFIDGGLFGVNRFPGAVEMIHVGYLGGKIVVDGDLDSIIIAGDAGYRLFNTDPLNEGAGPAMIHVGRVLGSVVSGGVMSAKVLVDGNMHPDHQENRPFLRSEKFIYEHEISLHGLIGSEEGFHSLFSLGWVGYQVFGDQVGYIRNDTLGQAQYIGRETSYTRVLGTIGSVPEDDQHEYAFDTTPDGGDRVDVYAIAVDGQTELRIELLDWIIVPPFQDSAFGPFRFGEIGFLSLADAPILVTIQDAEGNILQSRGFAGIDEELRFTPNGAGVVYVVLESTANGTLPYQLIVRGQPPTTLGEVRSLTRMRYTLGEGAVVSTAVGSIGAIRVGQDWELRHESWDAPPNISDTRISAADSLWNVTSGGFIGGGINPGDGTFFAATVISAGGHIGSVLAGFGYQEWLQGEAMEFGGGSLMDVDITAGGHIGTIWAKRETDSLDFGDIGGLWRNNAVSIGFVTIDAGGSIGVMRAENRIITDTFGVQVSVGPGGVIDLVEAGAEPLDGRDIELQFEGGGFESGVTEGQMLLSNGPGGNVRFFRAPHIFFGGFFSGARLFLAENEAITLVDDSGAEFTVRLQAGHVRGADPASAVIFTHGVTSARGVAVARITADLPGGANLIITNNSGNVEIGDIIVFYDSPNSQIHIQGTGRTDVYLIRAILSEDTEDFIPFDLIQNRTIGDVIAIDVPGLNRLWLSGNLGRTTQSNPLAPRLIGPFYGINMEGGEDDEVGGPLRYDPIYATTDGVNPNLAGAPMSPWLNGLSVRGGDIVNLIEVSGTIVDVIAQTNIGRIWANRDNNVPFGEFHGVEGHIHTPLSINRIDLGSGLAAHGSGPFQGGMISAGGVIGQIHVHGEGNDIRGWIAALNFNLPGQAIGLVNARNGSSIIGATITTEPFDDHFFHIVTTRSGDNSGAPPRADIGRVLIQGGGHLIDSSIVADNINRIDIIGGIWDSNFVVSMTHTNFIRADEFIYTNPHFISLIIVGGNVRAIETIGMRGDMRDLTVEILGDLHRLGARDMIGVHIQVQETLRQTNARGRMARSEFITGAMHTFNVREDIVRVTVQTAGPVRNFRSQIGSIERIDLLVDGPDGRLDVMSARNHITGEIAVAGQIRQMRAFTGDIIADVRTFTDDAHLNLIQAGRDLLVNLDINGNMGTLRAGRNLGDGGSIKVFGNLGHIDASRGDYNARAIVEGHHTGTLRVLNFTPGSALIARGRISTVDIRSDFDGDIISYADGVRNVTIRGDFIGGEVTARNGTLTRLTVFGDLAGDVRGDTGINSLRVATSRVNGDFVGGNFFGNVYSDRSIQRMDVDGSIDGGRVVALHDLRTLMVRGDVVGGAIMGAGSLVNSVTVMGGVENSFILAGLESLGANNQLGGVGLSADRFTSGDLRNVVIRGSVSNTVIAAGLHAGTDGAYSNNVAQMIPRLVTGRSTISNVTIDGPATNGTLILADTGVGRVRVAGEDHFEGQVGPDLSVLRINRPAPQLANGIAFSQDNPADPFIESDGDVVMLTMRGPGQGFYTLNGSGDLSGLVFHGTAANTVIEVVVVEQGANGDGLVNHTDDFVIEFQDDAEVGTFTFGGNMTGALGLFIDGSANTLNLRDVNTSGTITVGGLVRRVNVGTVTAGLFDMPDVQVFEANGNFGGRLVAQDIGTFNARNSAITGVIFGRDQIRSVNAAALNSAGISSRGDILGVTAGTSSNLTRISAGNLLRNVRITENMSDTDLLAGLSLGSNGHYGGTGDAADILSAGKIHNVTINGSMIRSNIIAGMSRGKDAFYGTSDDIGALGLSEVRNVRVGGSIIGSNFGSETYAIAAASVVDRVLVAGRQFHGSGNVRLTTLHVTPIPLEVVSVQQRVDDETFFIEIVFNDEIDTATVLLDPANPQAETAVRFENPLDPGGVRPLPTTDYQVRYNKEEKKVTVEFTRAFARANPGLYTLVVDAAIRNTAGIGLDATGNGVPGDDFRQNFQIGDAGDRTTDGTWTVERSGQPDHLVDFHAAAPLDLILWDYNANDFRNRQVIIANQIGIHPDMEPIHFPRKFDVDLYRIELEPGDMIQARLLPVEGSSFIGSVTLRTAEGEIAVGQGVLHEGFISETGGEFFVSVMGFSLAAFFPPLDISNTGGVFTIPFPDPIPIPPNAIANDIGAYELGVIVFNDGDTGFGSPATPQVLDLTDGQTTTVEDFIGLPSNGVPFNPFADADVFDISRVRTVAMSANFDTGQVPPPGWSVTPGPNGVRWTNVAESPLARNLTGGAGDAATAVAGEGAFDTWLISNVFDLEFTPSVAFRVNAQRGPEAEATLGVYARVDGGAWQLVHEFDQNVGDYNVPNGQLAEINLTQFEGSTVELAWRFHGEYDGPEGARPYAQIDEVNVHHKVALREGMTVTVSVDMGTVGGNLGFKAEVGVFQATQTTAIGDALMIGAPGFREMRGLVHGASDVEFSFRVPEEGAYAVMVQGDIQTNYLLSVTVDTSTTGPRFTEPQVQNILLELNGGTLDWLERWPVSIPGFNLRELGFQGLENDVIVRIIEEVEQDFADAGVTVNVSTNPAEFVGQEFTTIFLTGYEPTRSILRMPEQVLQLATPRFSPPLFFNPLSKMSFNDFITGRPVATVKQLDPQNQNRSTEAAVFVPSFAPYFAPGQHAALASTMADAINHAIGLSLGLRHAWDPDVFPFEQAMMDEFLHPLLLGDRAFMGDPNAPYATEQRLTDGWYFGRQNEKHLLQLIFNEQP